MRLPRYGRPNFVTQKGVKPYAQLFMDKFARRFMSVFYQGIIRQHMGDQFVYFKTLAPAITYLNFCVHYGGLFQLLLENNCKHLDHMLFTCMFRIVRLTAKDLCRSQWHDEPQEFVDRSFTGFGAVDGTFDPLTYALKLIQHVVCIRSRY